jgi:hypothetical protein
MRKAGVVEEVGHLKDKTINNEHQQITTRK